MAYLENIFSMRHLVVYKENYFKVYNKDKSFSLKKEKWDANYLKLEILQWHNQPLFCIQVFGEEIKLYIGACDRTITDQYLNGIHLLDFDVFGSLATY